LFHPTSLGLSRGHFYFAQRGHYHFAATDGHDGARMDLRFCEFPLKSTA